MKYWIVVTSRDNFRHDRSQLGFKLQGLPNRNKKSVMKMQIGDKVIYYVMGIHKFGAIAKITGEYYNENSKLWTDINEMWPARCSSEPEYVLEDDELIDAKKLIDDLSFIVKKEHWGTYLQGSIREIPEEDYKLIESEIRKVIAERTDKPRKHEQKNISRNLFKTESDYEKAVNDLPLQSNSLHDRIGEMLEQIGSWMDYNTQTRHKITLDHAYELDVAWLSGKNPEIAVEVQISGNLTEAKDRLAHARKFNYRKVIMVLRFKDIERLNKLLKHEPELRNWMDIWSIEAVYKMYIAGENFFNYYRKLRESVYKEKHILDLVH